MENDLDQLEQKVAAMDGKVTKILFILSGNELDTESGIVYRQKEMEKRLDKLETWVFRFFWMLAGMSLPAGVGTWELIKNFIKP